MRSSRTRSLRSLLVAFLALALFAAACGEDEVADPNASTADAESSDGSGADRESTEVADGELAEQTAPVTLEGDPLPAMPEGVRIGTDGEDPAVGAIAPTLTGTDFDGDEVVVGPDGTPTVVIFAAHWCPHCQREIPVVLERIAAGARPDGLEVVVVSTAVRAGEDNYSPQEWLAAEGWSEPVIRDSAENEAVLAYGAGGFPYVVYLDGDNRVVARSAGELEPATMSDLWAQTAEA